MSKGNMLQGQARGKVGDLVFYVRKGSQETRVRNRKPANPRTAAQMSQRVKLGAAVAFYKRTASFFPFAYSDKTAKESDYNAFIRYNINLAPYMTKEEILDQVVVPAPYIISSGPVDTNFEWKFPTGSNTVQLETYNTKIKVADAVANVNLEAATVPVLIQYMNLQIGDLVTISEWVVTVNGSQTNLQRNIFQYKITSEDYEQYLTASAGTSWALWAAGKNLELAFGLPGDCNIVASLNKGGGSIIDAITFEAFGNLNTKTGVGFTVSRRNGSKVEVSDTQIVLDDAALEMYDLYRSETRRLAAMESYGSMQEALLDPADYDVIEASEDMQNLTFSPSEIILENNEQTNIATVIKGMYTALDVEFSNTDAALDFYGVHTTISGNQTICAIRVGALSEGEKTGSGVVTLKVRGTQNKVGQGTISFSIE